jgi:hypothetical protein
VKEKIRAMLIKMMCIGLFFIMFPPF